MKGRGKKAARGTGLQETTAFHVAASAAGLQPRGGKDAVEGSYRAQIIVSKGAQFTGSVDVDGHFSVSEPQSHRWDYGLGLALSDGAEIACWVEPHPASSTASVGTMLRKLDWLKAKLKTPPFRQLNAMTFKQSQGIQRFHWLLTPQGVCRITAASKEARTLAKAGLRMPARQITLP
jgi:hypothetical protein